MTSSSKHNQASPSLPKHPRILIVGDSITHGGEGDYTWRYRLWQWLQQQNISATFVGPYTGVNGREPVEAPHPPPFAGEPESPPKERIPWGYAEDVDETFRDGCRHFATWGYQAAMAKEVIVDVVRESDANLMLCMLGFNDVGWFVDDADGTLESVKQIVDRARSVQPEMNFAIANIVQRTFMLGREDLVEKTNRFNTLLKGAVRDWSRKESRVVEVDVASAYQCGPTYEDRAPAAYDGLHPNAFGEYEIAQAFSKALHRDFSLGSAPLVIPDEIPKRHLPVPSNFAAQSSPMGVKVTWDNVTGAEYRIRHRRVGESEWSISDKHNNRHDIVFIEEESRWEVSIRSCHGYDVGDWSDVYTAMAGTVTIPNAVSIRTHATKAGFEASWHQPESERAVDCYEVAWKDNDVPAPWFTGSQSIHGTSANIQGLPAGHHVSVWIRPWTKIGEEWASGGYRQARSVRIGSYALQRPHSVHVTKVNGTHKVKLEWIGSEQSDAGYLVYTRDITKQGSHAETGGSVFKETTCELECQHEIWNYEFSVSAVNGSDESPRSAAIIPSREDE